MGGHRFHTGLLGLALLALVLAGCDRPPSALDDIRRSGKLVVLTRNAPTTYYEGRDGPEGYEFELASRFAAVLGVTAEFRVLDSVEAVLAALERGEGHIAAAGITRTEGREESYRFGPDYLTVQQEVVCRRGGPQPVSADELQSVSLRVVSGSSYAERLRELRQEMPQLAWEETADLGTEQLLQQVWEEALDCTVADSNVVAINRRYMPELLVAFPLTEQQHLAWVLPSRAEALARYLSDWFDRAEQEGVLARLYEQHYGYAEIFDYVDLRRFVRRIDQRLPRYEKAFRSAAEAHGLPWTLLAAQAYQESHWNPRAKSPTGVRGIMMLTLATAREMGVKRRLDPAQSISGGAKYLARLVARVPETVKGDDRLWFALAAYNVGFGHLRDARTLAEHQGKDPDSWVDLKEVLPLLARREHYRSLKYGYARGWEPVQYVQRIRDYRDVLERWLTRKEEQQALVRTAALP